MIVAMTAEAEDRKRYAVLMPFTTVEHFATPQELKTPCLTDKPLYGCTRFGGRRLECNCEREGDTWQINARAQFISFIYLTQQALLRHEKLHVDDVRRDVEEYVKRLADERFVSAAECEDAGRLHSESFSERMEAFQAKSNFTRHRTKDPRVVASTR